MTSFYVKVIDDKVLAHFFTNELGDDITNKDWTDHIDLLADFWLAKLLGEKTYEGNVFGMHTRVPGIKRESFTRWMELFSVSVDEVYVPKLSKVFKHRAGDFSKQFISFLKI